MVRIQFVKIFLWAAALVALLVAPVRLLAADAADQEFAKDPTWSAPKAASIRAEMFKWLEARKPDDVVRKQAEALWPAEGADAAIADPLPRAIKALAIVDPQAGELVELCAKPKPVGSLPKFAWLTDEKVPAFERNNLRLWYGRWLSQEKLYDTALEQLAGLEPADVVDPAALLFYQATVNHWLLHKEPGLKAIARLLERKKELPRRYSQTAALMQSDLAALKDESLDHIDRRMRDTERRLDLGHAGKRGR